MRNSSENTYPASVLNYIIAKTKKPEFEKGLSKNE
jgi:hypothetical protein